MRHNGVHFFDISTSKSGPTLVCFLHFDLETRFAPQRRALFRHLKFQKWSECDVLLACLLQNMLRATTACNFHLASWLRTRRFSEPTFRPSRATNHWINTVNRDFTTFPRTCIFFLLSFSSLIFSLLGFSSLTLPTSAFPSVHIVGSLTSKLPIQILADRLAGKQRLHTSCYRVST